MLGWAPATFWASTTDELLCAVDGWRRANGARDDEEDVRPEPLTHAELVELMKRFPDDR